MLCIYLFFYSWNFYRFGSFIRIACIYSYLTFQFADNNEQFVQLERMNDEKIRVGLSGFAAHNVLRVKLSDELALFIQVVYCESQVPPSV